MGYVICKFQNCSEYSEEIPGIVITEDDPGWDEALKNWKQGKNPTDSKLWKKGVIACSKEKSLAQEAIEGLQELTEVIERGEEPGCHFKIT